MELEHGEGESRAIALLSSAPAVLSALDTHCNPLASIPRGENDILASSYSVADGVRYANLFLEFYGDVTVFSCLLFVVCLLF